MEKPWEEMVKTIKDIAKDQHPLNSFQEYMQNEFLKRMLETLYKQGLSDGIDISTKKAFEEGIKIAPQLYRQN